MTVALALQIIEALIGDMPEIIADIEKLIAAIKGQSAPAPSSQLPLAPQVLTDTQATADSLAKPVT